MVVSILERNTCNAIVQHMTPQRYPGAWFHRDVLSALAAFREQIARINPVPRPTITVCIGALYPVCSGAGRSGLWLAKQFASEFRLNRTMLLRVQVLALRVRRHSQQGE